jgi:transposase
MIIIGCDYHPGFQQIVFVDTETGEWKEQRLEHREAAEAFYRELVSGGEKVRVGMEASGHAHWFERLLGELDIELWIGDAAVIRAKRGRRKPKTDRQDARHILQLMLKDDFPKIWVPSWENRDLRQLLWHRHRMVQARTRLMNQLQAVALKEGLRCKRRLWREKGRKQLEAIRLGLWASRRREDLLKLLDELNPTIAELTRAIEQEVEKSVEASRLLTHPGVGPLTALAFVLIIGQAQRFQCGKQVAAYLGLVPLEDSSGERRRLGHITKQGNSLMRFLLVESAQMAARSIPQWRNQYFHLAMRRGRKIAKVALARKLAIRLFWMMRQAWDYEQMTKFGSHAGQPASCNGVS